MYRIVATALSLKFGLLSTFSFSYCDARNTNEVKTVIFFGSSGVGKTTICNKITNVKHPTGSVFTGTSIQDLKRHPNVKVGRFEFEILDTAGLNASYRNDEAKEVLRDIFQLGMKRRQAGVALIVMVKPSQQTSQVEKDNFKMMKTLFPSVPFAIIYNKNPLKEDECIDDLLVLSKTKDFNFNSVISVSMGRLGNEISDQDAKKIKDMIFRSASYNIKEIENTWISSFQEALRIALLQLKSVGIDIDPRWIQNTLRMLDLADKVWVQVYEYLVYWGIYK